MTVEELIADLNGRDPKAKVYVKGYEGGYHDLSKVEVSQVRRGINGDSPFFGPHELSSREGDEGIILEEY